METENVVLMKMARESLSGKWVLTIRFFAALPLVWAAIGLINSFIPYLGLIVLIIAIPIVLGLNVFSLSLARDQDARFEQIFLGFKKLGTTVSTFLLVHFFVILLLIPAILVFIVFNNLFYLFGLEELERSKLLMFLMIIPLSIPWIMAIISFSMTFFIIADDDSIGAIAAIKKSKLLMGGYKWKFFLLILRFFGWLFLGALIMTPIILMSLKLIMYTRMAFILWIFLWLVPYTVVTMAKFYDDIKANPIAK